MRAFPRLRLLHLFKCYCPASVCISISYLFLSPFLPDNIHLSNQSFDKTFNYSHNYIYHAFSPTIFLCFTLLSPSPLYLHSHIYTTSTYAVQLYADTHTHTNTHLNTYRSTTSSLRHPYSLHNKTSVF